MSTTTGFPENPVHPSVHPAGPQVKGERYAQKVVGAVVVSSISGSIFIGILIWIYLRRRRARKARAASISIRPSASEISILPAGLSENFSFAPKVSVMPPTPDASEGQKHLALPNVSEVLSGPSQPALPQQQTDDIRAPRSSRRSWANRSSFRLSLASMSSGPSPRTSLMPADSANRNLVRNMAETGSSNVVR